MSYQPGQHLVATLKTADTERIHHYSHFKLEADRLIQEFQLQKLGEVYHDFNPGGFTAVICLSESHISIHTWPEYGTINLDIYLSNYKRNNDAVVLAIFAAFEKFFAASVVNQQIIKR